MEEEKNKLFLISDCPSAEVMQKYIADMLSPQEKNMLERHVSDCELCSDAIAGYSLLPDQFDLLRENKSIRKKIDVFFADKRIKKENLALWAAAASVVIILGATILFFFANQKNNNDFSRTSAKNLSIKSENESSEQGTISMNSDLALTPPAPEVSNNEPSPASPSKNNSTSARNLFDSEIKKEKERKEEDVLPERLLSAAEAEESISPASKAKLYDDEKNPESEQSNLRSRMIEATEQQLMAYFNPDESLRKAASKKIKPASSNYIDSISKLGLPDREESQRRLDHGLEQYEEKDYKHANEIFDALLMQQPGNEKIWLNAILTKIQLRKYEEALQLTQKLTSDHENSLSWKKWMTALIQIETNLEESKKLLLQLSQGKSIFKEEARVILKSIQEN